MFREIDLPVAWKVLNVQNEAWSRSNSDEVCLLMTPTSKFETDLFQSLCLSGVLYP